MLDLTTFLAQLTDPYRVITMIAITILSSGTGRLRWILIIAAAVLVALTAEMFAQREPVTQALYLSGFVAAMTIAVIAALIRWGMARMRAGNKS